MQNQDARWCSIANYIIDWTDRRFNDVMNVADFVSDPTGVVLAGVIGGWPNVVAVVASSIAAIIASTTITALRAAITADVIEDARHKLYCHIKANGGFDIGVLSNWRSQLINESSTNLGLKVWAMLTELIQWSVWDERAAIGELGESFDCIEFGCSDPLDLLPEAGSRPAVPLGEGVWQLRSTETPNTPDGKYYASYRLGYSVYCARWYLENVEQAFTAPSNAPFIGFRNCDSTNPAWDIELTGGTLQDASGLCFNSFYLHSDTEFEITIRITNCIGAGTVSFSTSDSTVDKGVIDHNIQVLLDLPMGTDSLRQAATVTVDLEDPLNIAVLNTPSVVFPPNSDDGDIKAVSLSIDSNAIGGDFVRLNLISVTSPATLGTPATHRVEIVDDDVWTHTFDFATGQQQGWTPGGFNDSAVDAVWTGSGWSESYYAGWTVCGIRHAIPAGTEITRIEVTGSYTAGGTNNAGYSALIQMLTSSGEMKRINWQANLAETNPVWEGTHTASGTLYIIGFLSHSSAGQPAGGGASVTKVTISGTGQNPFI